MPIVQWTVCDFVHRELLPLGQTINATVYSQLLKCLYEDLKNMEPTLVNQRDVILL